MGKSNLLSISAWHSIQMFLCFFLLFLFLQWLLVDGAFVMTWEFWVIPLSGALWMTIAMNVLLGIGLLVSRPVTKPETVQGRMEAFRNSRLAVKMIGFMTPAVILMVVAAWFVSDYRYIPASSGYTGLTTVLLAGAAAGLILSILTTTLIWFIIRRERPPFTIGQ